MKKLISIICCAAFAAAAVPGNIAFAESPVPVDVDPVVYEKLVATDWICDHNQDGTVTEEELRSTDRLIIDMEGVKDLSWFSYLDNCALLSVTGGDITDYSVVKDLPKLTDLQMHSVPITDISFAKDMDLKNFTLGNMPQITLEQRLEVAKWDEEVTIEKGFQKTVGLTPRNIIGDDLKCNIFVDDISVARVFNGFYSTMGTRYNFYGVAPGTTSYHITDPDGNEVVSGVINVVDSEPYDPPLGDGKFTGSRYNSFYYDKTSVALNNETLYRLESSEVVVCETDVKAFANGYRIPPNRVYKYFDVVAKNDGTLLLNGKVVPDVNCVDIQNECVITDSGELYGIYPDGRELVLLKIADDFKEFTYTGDDFYINKNGEVVGYYVDYDDNDKPYAKTFPTGVMNPVSMHYNLFVDEDNVLWHLWMKYGELSTKKIAEDAVEVGYYPVNEYLAKEYLYKDSEGNFHPIYSDEEFQVYPDSPTKFGFLKEGRLYIYQYEDEEQDISGYIKYFITADGTLTLDNSGRHCAITNVAQVIDSEYDKENELGYAYFFRTDGSMWRYCFETEKFEEMIPSDPESDTVIGDVNSDGAFDISDLVMLQKWLLNVPETELVNWKAADCDSNDKLNVFDLCMLKQRLVDQ